MIRTTLFAAGAAAAALAASAASAEMKTLNFGIISTESTQNLRQAWDPFLADMQEKLGMEVKAFFALDYAGIIQGMRFDKVDIAWFGNKSAMEAVDRAGGEVFVQTVDSDGNPGYWSLLITQKDSPLESLDDVLEKAAELNFGYGDPNSTSGYLVPSYYVFARNGVEPGKAFKRVVNANHETNALAVANGQVDVATNNTENLRRLENTHPDKAEKIKVIWQSPLIPSDPIVWRKNLPEEVKAEVKEFFLTYGVEGENVEAEKQVLAGLQWAPFEASSDAQLIPIRQLELFREKTRLENDQEMAADEKRQRLAEIDEQLDALDKATATN